MALIANNNIITTGLVLYLDAGNTRSYPGSGTTWYDISGNGRNYTFGAGISWNSAGYFSCSSGVFTGPASNTFGFDPASAHTIEAYVQVTGAQTNNFFDWRAAPKTGTDTRAIFSHLYYSNGNTYYDINGCCGITQRINYANDSDLTAGVRQVSWRTRTETTPYRQFFKNNVSQMDSGANGTATVTWSDTTAATIANNWAGNLYSFRVYDRALSDAEMSHNFAVSRARYGV